MIYDAKDADPDAFTRLILSGPMVNPAMPPMGHDRFNDRYRLGTMAQGLEGAFKALAVETLSNPQYSGLDYVGVGIYRELLRQVPGTKLGTIHEGGRIEWEPSTITTTNPEDTKP